MNLAILSRSPRAYSTRRLREAAAARDHSIRVMNTLQFSLLVEPRAPQLRYRNRAVPHLDGVIPRIGSSITFFGTSVVRQFEQMGVFTHNPSQAITVSRDKLRSMQILSRHDIGLPPSALIRDKNDILPAIERVGGAPVIIKLLEGTQGIGVILADTLKVAEAICETLQSAKQSVLVQKFVAESKGRDIRAFVVGGRVVAAMRRTAVGQEFRSNVHRGGTTEAVELDDDYARTAVRAAGHIMGLHVAGVDMLEGADGPQVLEVNSSPGLEGIEEATGLDVATTIIEHLEEQVQFPVLDLRERLTLNKGYGVVEFPVTRGSVLLDRAIEDTDLDEREIRILSIERQGLVLPHPRGPTVILSGDVLLCYGKLLSMKALMPSRRPRRRRKPAVEG